MSTTTSAWGHTQTFRTRRPATTAVMVCLTVIVAIAALGSVHDAQGRGSVGAASLGLMALLCAWVALQLICGRVSVSADGITIRGAVRSRHYRGVDVARVEVAAMRRGRVAVLWLRSGKRVRLQSLSAGPRPLAVTQLYCEVDEINYLLGSTPPITDTTPPPLQLAAAGGRDRRRPRRRRAR